MPEQPVSTRRRAIVDHGQVNPDCPVDCLRLVLPLKTLNPLARAYDAPFDPPRTVGDVIELCRSGQLRGISGLGQRRILEIAAALVFTGLDITGDAQRSQDTSDHGKPGEAP